ncbi:hypothetical protein BDQ12DRAFT_502376 [Crucibulum laeve]|uniref:Uncharacterized protein n=1 Tax=Crucibulum laeve TaxID=68775 RepID=A0A5C3LJL3_9AGAR|nr:hypothetical protein BDQ12DRAFT_502376 [Crucibulum laeve]
MKFHTRAARALALLPLSFVMARPSVPLAPCQLQARTCSSLSNSSSSFKHVHSSSTSTTGTYATEIEKLYKGNVAFRAHFKENHPGLLENLAVEGQSGCCSCHYI